MIATGSICIDEKNAPSSNQDYFLDKTARKLAEDNMEVARKLAWKLLGSWQVRLPEDEVCSIAYMALCEAAKNYDGRETTQFQTFLYYHVRGRLLREISAQVQHSKITQYWDEDVLGEEAPLSSVEVILSSLHDNPLSPEQILVEREQDELFEEAFSTLDWLEKEIVISHYFDGKSLNELAISLKYCRCHLSRVKSRAISKLKKGMNLMGVVQDKAKNEFTERKLPASGDYSGGRGRRSTHRPKVAARKSATLKELCLFGGEAMEMRA
ncbi:MAG TPA: sigma-70 family RNA polymerase sigma factor [Oligoflexia bacterium]|nr:sigma-70 family RNA polymerase sigma factor [Oligoflexia bacterium]HMP48288.1 sigma-70 family RNA polymerase sigma factor [Oligoflexia bacterium]